jgi:hypothetical protein
MIDGRVAKDEARHEIPHILKLKPPMARETKIESLGKCESHSGGISEDWMSIFAISSLQEAKFEPRQCEGYLV